jgi:pimeloyl-ACP methyl ester carboxylesterase
MYRLTCRENLSGRGVTAVRPADGLPDPATAGLDRWVILVHGFNNSRKSAEDTWELTAKQLAAGGIDVGNVVLFFWPGDFSSSQILSAMSYPLTLPIAQQTAQQLATYLEVAARDRKARLRISFVAHSLGSLVVLETLRLLQGSLVNVVIENVLLMAAAVPEGFCYHSALYGDRFSSETSEVVLYSVDDTVLSRFFQIGQRLAQQFPPRARRAVGRDGGPGSGPRGRWSESYQKDGFDHGDYWKQRESIAEIARVIQPQVDPYSRADEWVEEWARRTGLPNYTLTTGSLADADELPEDEVLRAQLRR